MKKKIFTLALSACLFLTSVATMTGTAYAGEAENVVQKQPAAAEQHDCGYEKPQGVCVSLNKNTDASRAKKAAAIAASPKNSAKPISGASIDNSVRIGKAFLQGQTNATGLVYAYECLAKAIDCCADTVEFTWNEETGNGITFEEVVMVYNLVREDYPEFFWWGHDRYICSEQDGIVVNIILNGEVQDDKGALITANIYLYDTYEEILKDNAKFTSKVEEIVAEVGEATSAYEKELFFHDWLALNNTYDVGDIAPHNHDAYGALLTGSAVCEGYTRAMQLLLNEMNIDNYTVSGTSRNVGHTWNVVKLDDGKWYQIDVTWDDQGDTPADISYVYFNITTEQMSLDHAITPAEDANFPNYVTFECNATEYAYYNVNSSHAIAVKQYGEGDKLDELAGLIAEFINDYGFARIYVTDDVEALATLLDAEDEDSLCNLIAVKRYIEGYYSCECAPVSEREWNLFLEPSGDAQCPGKIVAADVWDWFCQDDDNTNVIIRAYPQGTTLQEIIPLIQLECGKEKGKDTKCLYEAEIGVLKRDGDSEDYLRYTEYLFQGITLGTYQIAMYKPGCPVRLYEQTVEAGGKTITRAYKENAWWLTWLGDVNEDWKIDFGDALLMKRYNAGWGGAYANLDCFGGDINGDGTVDLADIILVEQYLAGYEGVKNLSDFYGKAS